MNEWIDTFFQSPLPTHEVCVQPRSSAVNMTLPAFVAVRRAAASLLLGAQQQTRRTPLLLSIDGTDGRTDGRSTVL